MVTHLVKHLLPIVIQEKKIKQSKVYAKNA